VARLAIDVLFHIDDNVSPEISACTICDAPAIHDVTLIDDVAFPNGMSHSDPGLTSHPRTRGGARPPGATRLDMFCIDAVFPYMTFHIDDGVNHR
jgi:hypothetical protein